MKARQNRGTSFFDELDQLLETPIELHCFGGFVVIHAYGVARTTNDIDFISLVPHPMFARLCNLAGQGSELHRKHRLYLHPVALATPPEDYLARLVPLFPGVWRKLSLFALEAHDLALTKLERNYERDREDVQRLAQAGHLDRDVLTARYSNRAAAILGPREWA